MSLARSPTSIWRIITDGHQAPREFRVHPGAWLRSEIVEPHGLLVTEAASRLRGTR
jgi:predicted DNA-binding transcriptional regulator AlpA